MTNSDHKQIAGDVLVIIASVLTALPLFIIAHKELPLLNWPYEADRILLFLIIVALLLLILRVFRWLIVTGFFLLLLWLGYGSLTSHYGFTQLYHDYSAMIFASVSLDSRVSGAGSVRYKGNATTVNQKVSGAGSVKKAD